LQSAGWWGLPSLDQLAQGSHDEWEEQ